MEHLPLFSDKFSFELRRNGGWILVDEDGEIRWAIDPLSDLRSISLLPRY